MYSKLIKPFFDKIFALTGLLLASPILLLVIILLALFQKGKVFFVQERPGINNRLFKLIKFKTMTDEKDEYGNLLADDLRITWIGKVVRKTSIDEVPQLVNILLGDMSFVGPRPLLIEYLPLYSAEQAKRHKVKPGISGWAQVNGRNTLSWEDKFKYDLQYVKNQSFLLDLKIIALTIKNVLLAKGISGEGTMTMQKFTGNSE